MLTVHLSSRYYIKFKCRPIGYRWVGDGGSGSEFDFLSTVGHAEMAKDIANITEIEVQVDGKTVTTISKFEGKDNKVDIVVLDETTEKEGPDGVKIVVSAA